MKNYNYSEWIKALLGCLIHGFAWIVAHVALVNFFADSPAKNVYGIISGWWCATYVGYVLKIGLRSLVIGAFVYPFLFILAFHLGWRWIWHDLSTEINLRTFVLCLIITIVFLSPILVNSIMQFLVKKLAGVLKLEV